MESIFQLSRCGRQPHPLMGRIGWSVFSQVLCVSHLVGENFDVQWEEEMVKGWNFSSVQQLQRDMGPVLTSLF